MTRLLLHPRYDEDAQRIWQVAMDAGWTIVRADYGGIIRHAVQVDALYGGYMWAEHVAPQSGLRLISPPERWWEVIGDANLIRRSIGVERYCDLAAYDGPTNWPKFIKSLTGKSIASRVYHSLADLPPGITDEEQFIVSYPVSFAYEWRAFVLDGEVVTLSHYATHGNLDTSGMTGRCVDARTFAKVVAWYYREKLPRAYVLDVGLIKDDDFAIVEMNPAYCSGLYACDADAAFRAIVASCERVTPGS